MIVNGFVHFWSRTEVSGVLAGVATALGMAVLILLQTGCDEPDTPSSNERTGQKELKRPQRPDSPRPYHVEKVTFRGAGGVELTGILSRPVGEGPFPGVVLVHGSGPANRDYEIRGHRFFQVLADYLTRHGTAVLRYDKRGIGNSEGTFASADHKTLARDAAAALRLLKNWSIVDAAKSGVMAHSEGGLVASRMHLRHERASFLVLLAPLAPPGYHSLPRQHARRTSLAGAPDSVVDSLRLVRRRIAEAVRSATDSAEIIQRVKAIYRRRGASVEEFQEFAESSLTASSRDFIRSTPRQWYRNLDVPVFVLYGENDIMVEPERNADSIQAALQKSATKEVTVRVIEDLNHWMQPAETGRVHEIAQTDTTIDSEVLEKVTAWINRREE
jgi:pimeloyl-ACP methyl ester carboxylesterase